MKTIVCTATLLLLAACSSDSDFKARTSEGAACKSQCASQLSNCTNSKSLCQQASDQCLVACRDADDIKKKAP